MKDHEITLGQLFDFATKHLPESWELSLFMFRDEVTVSLEDPDYQLRDVCRDDMDTGEVIQALVNHARAAEGLPVAWFPGAGLPCTPELVAAAERELEADPVEVPEELADPEKAWDRMKEGGQ
jgi:hypothetical protein